MICYCVLFFIGLYILVSFVIGLCYVCCLLLFSHIYQPVVDSLVYVAHQLADSEARRELLLKSLQLFVQQGIEAKKASDKADITHKVISAREGRGGAGMEVLLEGGCNASFAYVNTFCPGVG